MLTVCHSVRYDYGFPSVRLPTLKQSSRRCGHGALTGAATGGSRPLLGTLAVVGFVGMMMSLLPERRAMLIGLFLVISCGGHAHSYRETCRSAWRVRRVLTYCGDFCHNLAAATVKTTKDVPYNERSFRGHSHPPH